MKSFFEKSNIEPIDFQLFFKYDKLDLFDLTKKYEIQYNIKIDNSNSVFFIYYFLKMNKDYYDSFEKMNQLISFFYLEYELDIIPDKDKYESSIFIYDGLDKTINIITNRKGKIITLIFRNIYDEVVK
jgi:hypothetical protein